MREIGFTRILRNGLMLLGAALVTLSCTEEIPSDPGFIKGNGDKNALVTLEVRIPGNNVPATKALTSPQEDEVSEIIVFSFEKGNGNSWDTKLKHVGKSSDITSGSDTKKQFKVGLLSGEWDLWVVANANGLMGSLEAKYGNTDLFSEEFLNLNLKKSDLQAAITMTSTGKWNVDPDDEQKGYRIPMWGMLNAVKIEQASNNIIRTVNLYRMLSKIDVMIQREADDTNPETYPGIPFNKFKLTYVSLHNYTTTARLVPGVTSSDGDWLAESGGVALRPSLPANPNGVYGWEPAKRLEYSSEGDFTEDGTGMEGMIYTFEAGQGTDNYSHPCIIIGGYYDQDDEVSYYRADFISNSKEYMSLLRNHKYRFLIRKIGGKGFPSVEEAYKGGPTNIEADVIEWNDGNYVEGIWNGNYEIRFSSVKAHFSQFSETSPQVINVRSNVPTLSLDDFTTVEMTGSDSQWSKTGTEEWSNGHFSVSLNKTATMGDYSDYKLIITANPAQEPDAGRHSTFKVKGYMLEVLVTITQDYYIKYLLNSLDASTVKAIDGARQRVPIGISSTRPYKVDLKGNGMFLGVYDVAMNGSPIDPANIPENTNHLWIEVAQHSEEAARVGEFFVQHVDPLSTAGTLNYQILQITPNIKAVIDEGGYIASLPTKGGELTINVTSNLSGWVPVLSIDGVPYNGSLSNYFDMVQGAQSQSIVFRLGKMPDVVMQDMVYTIHFRDINNSIQTRNPITITHKFKTKGLRAEPGILSVDEDGVLNLDGRGHVVYFKWGSTIAIYGRDASYVFEGADDIAWTPEGFDVSAIFGTGLAVWEKVTYAKTKDSYPVEDVVKGWGDPCVYAIKDGQAGNYRMPISATEQFTEGQYVTDYNGLAGRWSNYGSTNSQFFPLYNRLNDGKILPASSDGYYWTKSVKSGSTEESSSLKISSSASTSSTLWRGYALPIRCVRK